jgi:hypothetical protein
VRSVGDRSGVIQSERGEVPARITPALTLPERFWSKVSRTGPCWLWTGSLTGSGQAYGQIRDEQGTPDFAHRVAWRMVKGPIPAGMLVLHRCDVPRCVRPDHLYLGTAQDNADDRVESLRATRPRPRRPSLIRSGQTRIVSVRFDDSRLETLNDLSRSEGISASDVVRRALDLYAALAKNGGHRQ